MNTDIFQDEEDEALRTFTLKDAVNWAIAAGGKLAFENPPETLEKVRRLCLGAHDFREGWPGMLRAHLLAKKAAAEGELLTVSLDDGRDSLLKWVQENATDSRDQFKSKKHLINAIHDMAHTGVALKESGTDGAGKTMWEVELLTTSNPPVWIRGGDPIPQQYSLSLTQARDFLRLRAIKHAKPRLQQKWQSSLAPKSVE